MQAISAFKSVLHQQYVYKKEKDSIILPYVVKVFEQP